MSLLRPGALEDLPAYPRGLLILAVSIWRACALSVAFRFTGGLNQQRLWSATCAASECTETDQGRGPLLPDLAA